MMSDSATSVARRFTALADAAPDRDALVFPEMAYSYGMLSALSKAFAIKMADLGVGRDATIQLETTDLPVVLAALLASSRLGARFAEAAITDALAADNPVTHRFGTPSSGSSRTTDLIIIDATWSPAEVLPSGGPTETLDSQPDLDAPWLVLATSGTTGTPKVVTLSQRMVLQRSLAVGDEFLPDITRVASLFPYNCRPFFARALGALLNGAAIVDRGDWAFWARAGVNRVTGSVTQAKKLQCEPGNTAKIAVLEVSGATLSESEARRLLGRFALVDDTYGATETSKSFSNHVTLGDDGALQRIGAMRDSLVEIVTDLGALCAVGETGEVRVRNGYCADHYVLPDGGAVDALTEGYFYPGDIARWDAAGALEILRRKDKTLINFDGVKLSAGMLEGIMRSVDGIARAAAFESPKEGSQDLIAFVVFEPGCNQPQVTELARKACSDALGAKFAPVKIWPINDIPRKMDGQTDYDKCAEILLDGIKDLGKSADM